jgi:hypothetical protein
MVSKFQTYEEISGDAYRIKATDPDPKGYFKIDILSFMKMSEKLYLSWD